MSTYFKEKNGVGMADFIVTTRIAMSKELLLQTDKNVSEIADEVVFIRAFKRYEGVTSTQMREANE